MLADGFEPVADRARRVVDDESTVRQVERSHAVRCNEKIADFARVGGSTWRGRVRNEAKRPELHVELRRAVDAVDPQRTTSQLAHARASRRGDWLLDRQ